MAKMPARKIKSVTISTPAGDRFTYRDVARVFTNGDGSVTVMRDSNSPAIARIPVVSSVRYVR